MNLRWMKSCGTNGTAVSKAVVWLQFVDTVRRDSEQGIVMYVTIGTSWRTRAEEESRHGNYWF